MIKLMYEEKLLSQVRRLPFATTPQILSITNSPNNHPSTTHFPINRRHHTQPPSNTTQQTNHHRAKYNPNRPHQPTIDAAPSQFAIVAPPCSVREDEKRGRRLRLGQVRRARLGEDIEREAAACGGRDKRGGERGDEED
ncbi:hypothetical protein Droror1_Dr00016632 [Drosera rotundifolia]